MKRKKKWEFEDYLVYGYFAFCILAMLAFLAMIPLCAGAGA